MATGSPPNRLTQSAQSAFRFDRQAENARKILVHPGLGGVCQPPGGLGPNSGPVDESGVVYQGSGWGGESGLSDRKRDVQRILADGTGQRDNAHQRSSRFVVGVGRYNDHWPDLTLLMLLASLEIAP